MLDDPKEIEIISKAVQKNVANPNRSREPFFRIFEDFFGEVEFSGKTLLDLGPGQYDFGVLARDRGANSWGFDKDPAVLELGRYKDFEVREINLVKLHKDEIGQKFDGIFCKFSWNAFWFRRDDGNHRDAILFLKDLLKEDGWIWIAPWNGIPSSEEISETRVEEILDLQIKLFEEIGCKAIFLDEDSVRRYGVHGKGLGNNVLFTRNL